LPIIEAAHRKLPVIARDIPVFREVGGEHVFYFSGLEPGPLAKAVLDWLPLNKEGRAPSSAGMSWVNWKQSAQDLLDVILNDRWYRQWMPDGAYRFHEKNLATKVGKRTWRGIESTGRKGFLLFGPYVALAAGDYRVTVRGALGDNGAADARLEVVLNKGKDILAQTPLTKSDVDGYLASLTISLEAPCTDLETRIWTEEHCEVAVSVVEIRPFQTLETEGGVETEPEPRQAAPSLKAEVI